MVCATARGGIPPPDRMAPVFVSLASALRGDFGFLVLLLTSKVFLGQKDGFSLF